MIDWTTMGRGIAALAAAGALTACAAVIPADGEAELAQAGPAGDACGASAYQDLVGTSVGELQAARLPDPSRTIFPGMMVTQDFRPERLNVEVGGDDRIERVYCG